MSPQLAQELTERLPRLLQSNQAGAILRRQTWYMGAPMRWYRPMVGERIGRLYHRKRARWTDARVHESLHFDGPTDTFDHPFIQPGLHAIACEIVRDAPDRLLVESIGRAILITLMRHFGGTRIEVPRAHGLSRERMRRVVDYVESHLGEDLTLDTLAGVACLSPHHLSRSFHRATGLGLHRYVVQRRIERAKDLVLESKLPMAEIAWMVGFGSQAAFTKRFHEEVGESPARLRRARS